MEDTAELYPELWPEVRVLFSAPRKKQWTGTFQHRYRSDPAVKRSCLSIIKEQFWPPCSIHVVAKSARRRVLRRRQDRDSWRFRHLLRPRPDRRPDTADRERPYQLHDH